MRRRAQLNSLIRNRFTNYCPSRGYELQKGANIGNMARILTGIDALWRIFQGLSNDATFIGRFFRFPDKNGTNPIFFGHFLQFLGIFSTFFAFFENFRKKVPLQKRLKMVDTASFWKNRTVNRRRISSSFDLKKKKMLLPRQNRFAYAFTPHLYLIYPKK